jgi:hypothetical protein
MTPIGCGLGLASPRHGMIPRFCEYVILANFKTKDIPRCKTRAEEKKIN